ncbi:MAG TPA: Holliday junction branch migration protein RuvA [Longimicrobiales bacterium]|nr:Holliday junction branch migration protein RuvA [Longimicrobiales bacterium]
MISRIRGTLLRRELDSAEIMTAGGVAYQVSVPLSVFERLPQEGGEVELITHQVVREDSIELFGFLHDGERRLFGRLLTASGVGPRLALSMLSTLPPQRLVRAIVDKDIAALRQVPGLGAKKAEKIAVELADRLDDLTVAVAGTRAEGRTAEDAVGALVALGYSNSEASEAVRAALDADGRIQGVELIRAALAAMSRA